MQQAEKISETFFRIKELILFSFFSFRGLAGSGSDWRSNQSCSNFLFLRTVIYRIRNLEKYLQLSVNWLLNATANEG